MTQKRKCPKDADEKPINCPACGRFLKSKHWIGENSNECTELSCVCGYEEIEL